MKKAITLFAGSLIATAMITGCGKQGITITSNGFNTTGAMALALNPFRLAAPDVTEFKFCVARVRLIPENGGNGSQDEVIFNPGLIDVSNGQKKDWGQVELPTGFKASGIRVKVKKDKDLCGVDYSVTFNGLFAVEDIELKWKFDPAVEVTAQTNGIDLNFAAVVAALRNAADAGTLNNQIKETVESVEDTAQTR